eukprot:1748-Eustigmatos_ZCMA.PRE.1
MHRSPQPLHLPPPAHGIDRGARFMARHYSTTYCPPCLHPCAGQAAGIGRPHRRALHHGHDDVDP